MKNLSFILPLLLIGLAACEKVIDIDLKNSEAQIVIEANLMAGQNEIVVNISRSTDFFVDEPIELIQDAEVLLTDQKGDSTWVPYVDQGQYTAEIMAEEDMEYTLTVFLEEEVYQAVSYLPKKVEITNASFEFQEASGPLEEGYIISFSFTDPGSSKEYYRIVTYQDAIFLNTPDDLQVLDDRLFNGGATTLSLIRTPFDPGAQVTVELRIFDEHAYDYFNSLSGTLGAERGPRGGQAAPGNPNTNWGPGILGHFTAYSADSVTMQLPD